MQTINPRCDKCDIRIPKYRPLLVCSLCSKLKHYKCHKLTKNDAINIINNDHMSYWTCQDCIKSIFPGPACIQPSNNVSKKNIINFPQFVMCAACDKPCSQSRTANCHSCDWCDRLCHKKCIKNSLGCIECCKNIIPGYYYKTQEITNSSVNNNIVFNPYDRNSLINQIGDRLDSEEEGLIWDEMAEKLKKCKYIESKNVKMSQSNELKIMSLNVRSLIKNIDYIREHINDFNKFDILSFCETNCNVDVLPNGLNDLLIEGFHEPLIQRPHRKSNRGGGSFSTFIVEFVILMI